MSRSKSPLSEKQFGKIDASRRMDAIADHLIAANMLAESHPDADLRYLLSDALMHVGQTIAAMNGTPAPSVSAD